MNKKYLYSMLASLLLLTSCDYNEDNFEGFDNNPVTDVVFYEGEFTGKYPSEGYFGITQGKEVEGKKAIEEALVKMLGEKFPYCDKRSSAKIKVKIADVMPVQSEFVPQKEYTLTTADYDAMGTDGGEPGVNDYFVGSDDEINAYLYVFLKNKYLYAMEGLSVKISYSVKDGSGGKNRSTIFRYDGKTWSYYNPKNPLVLSVNERITVLKKGDKGWELTNLISGTVVNSLVEAEYSALVEWVKINKPKYMSTQNTTSEYYFGASIGKYNQINNVYNTWTKFYNIDGYLTGLDNDQIQNIMDERLGNEGIPIVVLPKMITNPDPDMVYEVIYNVYGGRSSGNYAMSFYYNKEEAKFEWDEMIPRKK